MTDTVEGILIDSVSRVVNGHEQVRLYGRLHNRLSFCVTLDGWYPGFWVRQSDIRRVREVLHTAHLDPVNISFSAASAVNSRSSSSASASSSASPTSRAESPCTPDAGQRKKYHTIDGETVVYLCWTMQRQRQLAGYRLEQMAIRTYEADLPWPHSLLIDWQIRSLVSITGSYRTGGLIDRLYHNPALHAVQTLTSFPIRLLSLDIETEMRGHISAVSFVCVDLRNDDILEDTRKTILVTAPILGSNWIECVDTERELLRRFVHYMRHHDPDIITGWNVIEFDLRILIERLRIHQIPFEIGRDGTEPKYLPTSKDMRGWRRSRIMISGRQVIDMMHLIRYGRKKYDNYKLETVAQATLGRGKVEIPFTESAHESGMPENDTIVHALDRLRRTNPRRFAHYSLQDAVLPIEIARAHKVFPLLLERCQLIGLPMSRAWGSIYAFDCMYVRELHTRNIAAPTVGVDRPAMYIASGGGIITPSPGLYRNVLVFDFLSLYPSIIMTFNIDPLTIMPDTGNHGPAHDYIVAPNRVRFRRDRAILPELINRLFEQRKRTRQENDEIKSYNYKITMNSFYGIFGSSECRFGNSRLADAITGFGRAILHWSSDAITKMGYRVLYGDTDSLFVESGGKEGDTAYLHEMGVEICAALNERLTAYIEAKWGVRSRLMLEFEKIYERLLLPVVRANQKHSQDEPIRGRVKSYAGRIPSGQIEIVGMEAIRSDWTELAHQFQSQLLDLLFQDAPEQAIRELIHDTIADLYAGKRDNGLIYRKRLRKPMGTYTKSSPPHVRAARLLFRDDYRGTVRYIITCEGPQPIQNISSVPDYRYYVNHQLVPIIKTIASTIGLDISLSDPPDQLSLF